MPNKGSKIRGYIGESIVRQWLEIKYPEKDGFEIVEEILPSGVPKSGGPYLDFGVIKDGKVVAVF